MKESEKLKQEADKLDNDLAYLGAMLKTECVFSCYALNAKNAIKKFNQFKQNSFQTFDLQITFTNNTE